MQLDAVDLMGERQKGKKKYLNDGGNGRPPNACHQLQKRAALQLKLTSETAGLQLDCSGVYKLKITG